MRTLVVGDIHGAFRALLQCLDRSSYRPGDRIIFLGDYVDGFSESPHVVEHIIKMSEVEGSNVIAIRGNHDDWCKEWIVNGRQTAGWRQQGGQATFDAYIETGMLADERHRKFFRGLHDYYIDEKNRGYVHGGFISKKGLGHEPYHTTYFWDRDLWSLAMMLDRGDAKEFPRKTRRFYEHHEVYIGHTATTNWNCKASYKEWEAMGEKTVPITVPMNRCNVWNMDTGCGWDGVLTIMDVDTKEFWQSDPVYDLYPDEQGRKGRK